jgi:hypothetical protein
MRPMSYALVVGATLRVSIVEAERELGWSV